MEEEKNERKVANEQNSKGKQDSIEITDFVSETFLKTKRLEGKYFY